MPLVSSIESNLIRNEINERVKEKLDKSGLNFDSFDNFKLFPMNFLIFIIKMLLFIDVGFAIPFIIIWLIFLPTYYWNLNEILLTIWVGLYLFPNIIRNFLREVKIDGNPSKYFVHLQIFGIGSIIYLLTEIINPTFDGYIKGLLIYVITIIFYFILADIILGNQNIKNLFSC
jgi:hypothetical protein